VGLKYTKCITPHHDLFGECWGKAEKERGKKQDGEREEMEGVETGGNERRGGIRLAFFFPNTGMSAVPVSDKIPADIIDTEFVSPDKISFNHRSTISDRIIQFSAVLCYINVTRFHVTTLTGKRNDG